MKGFAPYYDKAMSNKIKWTLIAYPHPEWAKLMFPDLDERDAYKKLGKYIAKTTRIDNDDPVAAWQEHAAALRRKGQFGGIGVQKLRLPGGVKAGLPERGGAVCTPAQEHRPRQEQS